MRKMPNFHRPPSPEERTIYFEELPLVGEVRLSPLQQAIRPGIYNHPINEEAHSPAGFSQPIHSIPIASLEVGMLRPEYPITGAYDAGFRVTHPTGPMNRTTFLSPSFAGIKDYRLAAGIQAARSTPNLGPEWASMNVSQGQGHQSARFEKKLSNSVPMVQPAIPRTLTNVQRQQIVPRDPHQRNQKTRKGSATSSQSSRRPADIHGTLTRRYLCDQCSKKYTQPQGLSRHRREAHKPSLCRRCGTFEWGRPYVLKEHLKRCHPRVNPDVELKEIKQISRRTTTITEYLLQDSPTSELEQRGPQLRSPTPPPLAVTEVPPLSLPAFPPVACHSQFEFVEPTAMANDEENSSQFTPHNSYPRTLPLIVEHSQLLKGLGIYAPMQIWYRNNQGGCNGTNTTFYPVTSPIPTLVPPVNGLSPWDPYD